MKRIKVPKRKRPPLLLQRRSMCRQPPKHVIASRRERSHDRSAVQALRRHVGMPPYGVAIRFSSKSCIFKAFRMRIATPLFAFGKNADIGHSLQVLGDEGTLELVRAFGRFAMTVIRLCLQSDRRCKSSGGFCAPRANDPKRKTPASRRQIGRNCPGGIRDGCEGIEKKRL